MSTAAEPSPGALQVVAGSFFGEHPVDDSIVATMSSASQGIFATVIQVRGERLGG